MIVVIQGLRITTGCRYIKFTKSSELKIYEDDELNSFVIEFPKNFNSDKIISKHIKIINPCILHETEYIKIYNPIININGLIIRKLVQHDYKISQAVVGDIYKFTMRMDEFGCEILVPKSLDWDIKKYVCLISKNPYFKIEDTSKLSELKNIYSLNLLNQDFTYKSDNDFVLNTKAKFNKYLLRGVDVMSEFISQLRNRLEEYGVELLSLPIDKNVRTNNYVTYRFTEMDKQESHKSVDHAHRWVVEHKAHVEFSFNTPDLSLYSDFRVRFQNLDLISNFTEFYVLDKLKRSWINNVWWQTPDGSFNQDYSTNDQGNISFSLPFSADIFYSVVYDEKLYRFSEVMLELANSSVNIDQEDQDIITV